MTTPAAPWRRRFFTIWAGQQISFLGSNVAGFALIWWVTATTGSATVLASATLVSTLPQVLLGPFVGALVDRWNRRAVMLVADSAIALVSAWLAYLFWVGAMQIWHLYVVMFLRALGSGFHWPAMASSTTLLVPPEQYARVGGLNQMMVGAASVLAPMLGALLLSLLPLWGIMGLDVATALLGVVPLLLFAIPQPPRSATAVAGESLWAATRVGLRYILAWRGLFAILLLAALLNFLAFPPMSLIPILVTRHFSGGPLQLGWMNSAMGLGTVAGGILLGAWGGFRRRVLTLLIPIVGMGASLVGVGLAPAGLLPMAVASLFAGAVLNSLCNGAFSALLQTTVSPDIQGRVFTVAASISGAAAPIAMLFAGPIADAVDIRLLYIVPGALTLLMGLVALRIPAIMHVEDGRRVAAVDSN